MTALATRLQALNPDRDYPFAAGSLETLIDPSGAMRRIESVLLTQIAAKDLRSVTVALSFRSPVKFIEALLALDGLVGGMLLIGATVPEQFVRSLMADHGASALLSDRAELKNALRVEHSGGSADASPGGEDRSVSTIWILTTSGTTGVPKAVHHSLESLTRSIRGPQPASVRPHWGLLFDPSRFAGLQVIFQAMLGGGTLIAPDLEDPWKDQLSFLRKHGCTHLSATPSHWRKLLMSPESDGWPLQQITLGGEIADERLLNSLKRAYPDARITHIYASTEAGVGFSVADGLPGFPVRFLDKAPGKPELKIADGLLWVRPEQHEVDQPAGSHIVRDGEGFIRTGDRVRIEKDRVLILGRESALVNVGGVKVQPEDVERIVAGHPDVMACMVGTKPNSLLGAVITVTVTPNPGIDDAARLRADINRWCKQHLPREARPALITIADQMELGLSGKIMRGAK